MLFNATFNNISVILWRSVLLVEETGVPGENLSQVTKYYIYHGSYELTYLNQRIRRMSWFK